MSTSIVKTAEPAKKRIEKLIREVGELNLSQSDPHLSKEELRREYEVRRKIVKEKIMRLGLYINILEETNRTCLEYIQKITDQQTRKEEEDKYGEMIDNSKGIINLISEAKEAIITLNIYNDDNELALQRLNQQDAKELPLQNKILLFTQRRNDREWKSTIETMERILLLDVAGENLQHSSIEIINEVNYLRGY
ncbi:unnamed protein product [Onchocerca ochengi]|uniref:Caprin-1 dimerization domain-containing protein n=1 Tax=Onchocerca ochengi TaxID=42157 RepID=A0A182EWV7_ONCOC|nr:unnamed protein product [Onchocerca ochengi]